MNPDPGSANERTALAWQRTALSILAGSALLTRLTVDRLGWPALSILLVSGPLSLWVFWEARGRYAHDALLRPRPRARGGRAPLALTAATVVLAVAQLAALAARSG